MAIQAFAPPMESFRRGRDFSVVFDWLSRQRYRDASGVKLLPENAPLRTDFDEACDCTEQRSVAVTVLTPPFSPIVDGLSTSATVGAQSSPYPYWSSGLPFGSQDLPRSLRSQQRRFGPWSGRCWHAGHGR